MKLLIIGASGVLGSRLYDDTVKKKWDARGTFFSHECKGFFCVDMADKSGVHKIFDSFRPDTVALCGGITDVDLCEEKPGLAEEVNIKGTANVAEKAREYEARLVLVSTDYIFNGDSGPYSEEDRPSPVNIYGRTKLEAENIVREKMEEYLIVRTAQLYGRDYRGKNFALKIIKNMHHGKEVYAADDFYSTPTYAEDLSQSIIELIEKGHQGIFNIAGADFLDRYSYVNKIADIFNLKKSLINRVMLNDLNLKAARPPKAGLNVSKAEKILDSSFMTVEKGLNLFKSELDNASYEM